jgi:arsenite methyltransferase
MTEQTAVDIKSTIRERYGARAQSILSGQAPSCCGQEAHCCGSTPTGVNAFSEGLYAVDELHGVSLKTVLTTLGCANPTAISELREGETVLDIGSGAGLDVILSARRVGISGHAYGLDMTDEMLELAWRNALEADVGNVSFLKGEIEAIPIPDDSIDVVISNCVINLSTDKDRALSEVYRVLRPGGRIAIADVVIQGGLPEESAVTNALRGDPVAWGSCFAGALSDAEYRSKLEAAGFVNVGLEIVRNHHTHELLGPSLPAWTSELSRTELDAVMGRFTSTFIRAHKPTGSPGGDAGKGYRTASSQQNVAQSYTAQRIQEAYEQCASAGASGLCCSPAKVYSAEELANLPEEVLRLSSSCGTPVTDAQIELGATVVDIGSGAGADCFLAAQVVGPTGRIIGVDPSPTMREIASRHRDQLKLDWVSFAEGTAQRLPIPDATADVVISNCVLSLASDPLTVWREIARVLRPGGRFVVSDVVGGIRPESLESKTRCETGLTWSEYRRTLAQTRFTGVELLRVREVSFRDGHRAQSVTLQGRAGMPSGRTVQIFAPSQHHATAQSIAALCANAGQRHDARLALRIVDLSDPEGQSVLRLVLEEDLPGWDGETWPTLVIAGEGKLLATWQAVNGEEPFADGLVELALDYLMNETDQDAAGLGGCCENMSVEGISTMTCCGRGPEESG